MSADVRNRNGSTHVYSSSMPSITVPDEAGSVWERAVNYLLARSGQWVSGEELGHFLYQGLCSQRAPSVAVSRARQRGFAIDSGPFGYRMGKPGKPVATCPNCGALRAWDNGWVCYGCIGTQFVDLDLDRPEPAPGSREGKEWEPEENVRLRELFPGDLSWAEIGEELLRSEGSVRAQGKTLGLGKKPYRYRGGKR